MSYKKLFMTLLALFIIAFVLGGAGCQPSETETDVDSEEEVILEEEGIFVGQLDSQSVEIKVENETIVFELNAEVSLEGIKDDSAVWFRYLETEPRPMILEIQSLEEPEEILESQGIYTGQIDSHSVEIEIDGQPTAFALDDGMSVEHIADGTEVNITYQEAEHRPLLKSIEMVDEAMGGADDDLVGEGELVGLADAHSVEIKINRAFMLDQGLSVEDIPDGSLVVFSYAEDGHRAILESIEAVDQPLEGDVMHGTLIGQIDSQSVEIEYYQVFAFTEAVNLDEIESGAEIIFTYEVDEHRPVLTSITPK